MIKSMTGFGQAEGGRSPLRWLVEIRSWNHRFFECSTRLPNILSALDEKIRDLIHSQIKRGKITISVSLRSKPAQTNGLVLDEEKIDFYIRALSRVQKKYRLKDSLSINALLSVPNLFTVDQKEYTADHYWASLKPVLSRAIKRLLQAKVKEGAALNHDLKGRIGSIARFVERIESVAQKLPQEWRMKLKERISELTEHVSLDPARLEQEVAFLVERGNVTEELVRMKHHLMFMNQSLARSAEVGKKLDFIAQEIHREANTIASKAQNSTIAEDVILIKSELEKIREQVQNIE